MCLTTWYLQFVGCQCSQLLVDEICHTIHYFSTQCRYFCPCIITIHRVTIMISLMCICLRNRLWQLQYFITGHWSPLFRKEMFAKIKRANEKAHVLGYECSYYSFLIALGKRACSAKRFVDLVMYNAQIHMLTNSLCCLSQPGIFNLVTVSILLCLWIGVTIINARIFISVIITIHRVTYTWVHVYSHSRLCRLIIINSIT